MCKKRCRVVVFEVLIHKAKYWVYVSGIFYFFPISAALSQGRILQTGRNNVSPT